LLVIKQIWIIISYLFNDVNEETLRPKQKFNRKLTNTSRF